VEYVLHLKLRRLLLLLLLRGRPALAGQPENPPCDHGT
jgi:hypothetical protein